MESTMIVALIMMAVTTGLLVYVEMNARKKRKAAQSSQVDGPREKVV